MHRFAVCVLLLGVGGPAQADDPGGGPRAVDPRLEVVRFAQAPEIRHPINLDFDHRGRLLVIESHTHFRPAGYEGPERDRILALEDRDHDGHADHIKTFFAGTKFTMDLAVHPEGDVYIATRSEILRLNDHNRDGEVDRTDQIVRLETEGDYPHNGLSGLAFTFNGTLVFGMGENMGASYRLIGSDGTTIEGGGEGGGIFTCQPYGQNLRRIATGFWNPFGVTIDSFRRVWAVDNDPDAMPPCRLLHVVEGGDYGYQYRYGRSGRHPFQAWNGQLPGSLPMAAGTGESPCEVLSYESDGLPDEYVGNLLVTSWADHRVERYQVKPRGASYTAERLAFVQGGSEFRPVGLALAPDGSLFVSDWVRSDYTLHNQGAIWQIRLRDSRPRPPLNDQQQRLASKHRPTREAVARHLARLRNAPIRTLCDQLQHDDVRVRATALTAVLGWRVDDDLRKVADGDPDSALRASAVAALVRHHGADHWLDADQPPAVRLAAISGLRQPADVPRLLGLLDEDDPFILSAAVRQLSQLPRAIEALEADALSQRARLGVLLAQRAAGESTTANLNRWLDDPSEEVRFLAVKWIADSRLAELRPRVLAALDGGNLTVRMYQAYATALTRIDGQEVSDAKMADHFIALATDAEASPSRRVAALRLVPASSERLTLDVLRGLIASDDGALQLEAVRALAEHPKPERFALLSEIVQNGSLSDELRAEALVGLAESAPAPAELLLDLALGDRAALRDEALRSLTGEPLADDSADKLRELAQKQPETADLVARIVGDFHPRRPPHDDLPAWLERLDGPADAAVGRRVFFQPKLVGCFRCHRVDGRGREIGPDLSVIGRTERRHLLESILQPSNLVPPHYQVWQLELVDGRVLSGMLLRTHLDQYTYVDPRGALFQVRTTDIVASSAAPQSIMPTGMCDALTDQELRDLLAYLSQRR